MMRAVSLTPPAFSLILVADVQKKENTMCAFAMHGYHMGTIYWWAFAPAFVASFCVGNWAARAAHVWVLVLIWTTAFCVPMYIFQRDELGGIMYVSLLFPLGATILLGYGLGQIRHYIESKLAGDAYPPPLNRKRVPV